MRRWGTIWSQWSPTPASFSGATQFVRTDDDELQQQFLDDVAKPLSDKLRAL